MIKGGKVLTIIHWIKVMQRFTESNMWEWINLTDLRGVGGLKGGKTWKILWHC